MAQTQAYINIAAPGFRGLNTFDSPTSLSGEWALVARNAVIDEFGRIGARKGQNVLTTDISALSSNPIETMYEFLAEDSSTTIISAGNNKVFTGTTTLTDVTGGATITANDWSFATLNDDCYMFQAGHTPLVYRASTSSLIAVTAHPSYAATVPQGDIVRSAYGRLWVTGVTGARGTIYWSDLLIGAAWSGGSTGSLNVQEYWPDGEDEIVDIVAHNGLLVIFGRNNILIYTGADDTPGTNLALDDTITGIGAVQKNTAFVVGNDLWFMDVSGLRSLGRTIQEKSLPIGDLSRNVRSTIKQRIRDESTKIACANYPEDGIYIANFVAEGFAYVFDTRYLLEDAGMSAKTTEWQLPDIYCFAYTRDGDLLMGSAKGISKYDGYDDDGATYTLKYFTHYLDFGQPTQLKFPKKLELIFVGGSGQEVRIQWSFDYTGLYKARLTNLESANIAEYNIAEYNVGEYSASLVIDRIDANTSGNGSVISIGFDSAVNKEISLQAINLNSLVGRIR